MDLEQEIKNISEKLKKKYEPLRIILFGSAAEGKFGKDSDIDMLVIKDTKDPPMQRWMTVCKIARDFSRKTPFEPIVLTPEELKNRLQINDSFLKLILDKGKVLYERK